ncbi:MAG: hypothetical protein HY842_18230, partial [Bacteroidetes bacterium]|nr:hypothetical protein [Bacteroidota bacterium]
MRTSQHRITLVCLAVIFHLTASAQTFDGIFPQPPPKAEFTNPPAALLIPANFPTCGFDEMNDQRAASDPVFQEEWQHFLEEVVPQLSAGSEKSMVQPLLTISVVVHVIHNGEPVGQGQNLLAAQVRAQIDILNEDFAAINPQYFNTPSQWMGIAGAPNIQFCLANEKPDGSPTDGIDRQQLTVTGPSWNNNNINSAIKPAIKWDPLRYYNIYVLPIPGTTAAGGVVG